MKIENSIELKSINKILNDKFLIPSYQRGYRWNDQQVKDLLNDIWEFSQSNPSTDDYYCLQPVVVKENNNRWELIDGQQRLTTIFIILNYINNIVFRNAGSIFTIEFETRLDSQKFLETIDFTKCDKNIDYYHICEAFKVIEKWFNLTGNPALTSTLFYPALLNKTKVIWYQINDQSDARDIFTRINLGKIPLTNAELIKALFLKSTNFGNGSHQNDKIRLKQLEISTEWDRIENELQDDEFWYFINKNQNELPTRIEYIFNLMAKKGNNVDDYFTFRYFNEKFDDNSIGVIDKIWKEIKEYFLTFQEWFNDRELYHLVGYLITTELSVQEIITQSKDKTKTNFRQYLRDQIKKKVNYNIAKLDYNNNRKEIEFILLLFNIETLLQNPDSNYKFPFYRFKGNGNKKQKWSIEHIHAQNSKGLDTTDKRKKWIQEVKSSIDSIVKEQIEDININNIPQEMNNLLNNEIIKKDEFENLQRMIFNVFGESDLHTIDNLALLSADDNSSLNNSIFPVKRNRIIALEKNGSFIPICTRNVFLKYYSKNASHLFYWNEDDRIEYVKSIKETLNKYLPTDHLAK